MKHEVLVFNVHNILPATPGYERLELLKGQFGLKALSKTLLNQWYIKTKLMELLRPCQAF